MDLVPNLNNGEGGVAPVHNHYHNTIQDHSAFPTCMLLTESNYSNWAPLMKMRIGGRNKLELITEVAPEVSSPAYRAWAIDNEKVKCWLIDNMSPSLMNRYIRLPTAKAIWDALYRTYYDDSDETRLFELHRLCFWAKQNGRPLSAYYNELVGWLEEMDQRLASHSTTIDGVVYEASYMARLRVHMFLSGLDSEFGQVREEILRKDPKLDLEQSYAYIRRVHNNRMMHSTAAPEASVMATVTPPPAPSPAPVASAADSQRRSGPPPGFSGPPRFGASTSNIGRKPSVKFPNLTCTHCKDVGHTKERCYEIIGYPEWWDFTKRPRKNINKTAAAIMESSEQSSTLVAESGMRGYSDKADSWLWC